MKKRIACVLMTVVLLALVLVLSISANNSQAMVNTPPEVLPVTVISQAAVVDCFCYNDERGGQEGELPACVH